MSKVYSELTKEKSQNQQRVPKVSAKHIQKEGINKSRAQCILLISFLHSYVEPIGIHFSFSLQGLLEQAVMPVQSGPAAE